MVFAFKFPDLGEGIHEGKIVKWLVKEGDPIKADQIIAEVETDKAVVELPSPASGVLLKRYFQEGQTVLVGKVVVAIGSQDEQAPEAEEEAEKQAPATEHAKVVPMSASEAHHFEGEEHKLHVTIHGERPIEEKTGVQPTASQPPTNAFVQPAPSSQQTVVSQAPSSQAVQPIQVLATPATRSLARELGVDLSQVRGSGPGGRVMPEDVKKFAEESKSSGALSQAVQGVVSQVQGGSGSQAAQSGQAPVQQLSAMQGQQKIVGWEYPKINFPTENVDRVPITPLRKAIVQKMSESKRWIPHVTHFDEADVTRLEEIRQSAKQQVEAQGVKLTMLPFVAKAALNALKQFQEFNSSFDFEKQEIVLKKFYNLGIAVDTPDGLIVPVIKDAAAKNIVELAKEIHEVADRARERKNPLEELRGGTFTITNIGSVGGTGATPVINFPESAILGVFRAKDKPVAVEGKVVVRKIMPLCVSFDHRIIDGGTAARFLQTIVKQLEDPSLL